MGLRPKRGDAGGYFRIVGLARGIIVKFQPFRVLPSWFGEVAIGNEIRGEMLCFSFNSAGVGLSRRGCRLACKRNGKSRDRKCADEKTKANLRCKHYLIPRALSHFDNGK